MNEQFLAALINWKNGGNRAFHIDCGGPGTPDALQVWCFDYTIMAGTFVTSAEDVEQIDIIAVKKADLEAQMASLTKLNEK